ncbi:uncharacterized protein LOC117322509 isoform X2 [Pecten maximus]|uniref:uncharacterized protein LOC117322509 isoform X2 n=1 Tax=Pecten maximus TaxID=6579 RepID=UPI0014582F78|nr:uncharacterized protein LOC117322509 isoform X2 [Pecten maximus]
MKWIIIITIYLLQQFQSVQAAGSGILRFVNFTTPWGNGRYSNCCPDGQTSVCRGQCDVHINICVGDVSPDRNCIYGEGAFNFHVDETTREISFGDMTGSLPNPLVYRFDVWKLGVTVDVDVVIGESLLTDSIRFHLHTKPEPNGQVVKVGPQQYTGYRTGVTLEHSVSCDPFYFRECATLCLPDPATYTCDRNGNRRCLPDIDCGFEFTDSSTAYEEQVDGGGIYATVSNEFPSSSVDTVQEYSTHPSGSTAVNTEYIESAIESSTTGRGDFNENIISTENLKYSSQQDDVTSIGPFSDLLTSLHFNENTVSKENSTLTSKQEDVTSTRSYTDPTTLLMSETSEDETASVHKVTEAWSTSTDGETVITKVSNSPGDISEGTISYNSIDTATTDNSASTATPSTPTPSIPTPSTTDVTTLTVPHECTGHTTVSGDTKGKAVLTIQVAQGLQVVSMDVMEKKVVDFLSSAGFKVDTNDINAIKTSVGGLTIVNITIDDDDLAVSQTALGDFGNKLCTEESMFLIQPPSSGYTKEDTDGSNGVLVGMLVLAAYLLTLFIIAFILVRRKYRERNRISGRPMSEVSKMSQASELLTDRPETCMTGVLSEYGETNC